MPDAEGLSRASARLFLTKGRKHDVRYKPSASGITRNIPQHPTENLGSKNYSENYSEFDNVIHALELGAWKARTFGE